MVERNAAASSGADRRRIRATVKRYNTSKGYGFLAPQDGARDVFVHVSTLRRDAESTLRPGAIVECDVVDGARGPQAVEVISVDTAGVDLCEQKADETRDPTWHVEGRVKFYDPRKGFGFVCPDDGGKDVFVHSRALERAGLRDLTPNERMRLRVRHGQKGPQAEMLYPLREPDQGDSGEHD